MGQYKITAKPDPAERAITLLLNGRFDREALRELEDSLAKARGLQPCIYIDLSEVTLVDRKTAEYFLGEIGNVQIINCPAYLRQWILKGK